ncbi:MAG: chromate transporter [Hyphomicrobiales bacterium]|nr:chromate transporter [Hyphomicrobiales bacterium]
MSDAAAPPVVTYRALFKTFFWIGLFSFGGGLMPWIQREVVTVRGWMRNEDFVAGFAMAQVLPGVNSTNMAVYVGQRMRGVPGAAVAVVAMLTGPFLYMLAASLTYKAVLGAPAIHAAMAGAAAGAIGMILRMGVGVMASACRGAAPIAVMAGVFVAVGVLKWPLVPVVLVATPISILLAWLGRGGVKTPGAKGRQDA